MTFEAFLSGRGVKPPEAPRTETQLRAEAVDAKHAELAAEVERLEVKLQKARARQAEMSGESHWVDWIAHLKEQVDLAKAQAQDYRRGIREREVAEAVRDLDHAFALESAEALVAAIRAAGGPQMLSVWTRPGYGVRVYFPGKDNYLVMNTDGSPSDIVRGRRVFDEGAFYPNWRRAIRAGKRAYLDTLGERLDAHAKERVALTQRVRNMR